MEVVQLTLNIYPEPTSAAIPTGIVEDTTYPLKYLEEARKTYSASAISERSKLKGIFYHCLLSYACTGCVERWSTIEVLYLVRLYNLVEWEKVEPTTSAHQSHYWGKKVTFKGKTYILGEKIVLKPHHKDKAIAIAQEKVNRSIEKIDRLKPYVSGELCDPNWGRDYYQGQIEQAEAF